MTTINFRTDEELKKTLMDEARNEGFQNLSDYMTAIVNGRHKRGRALGKGTQKKAEVKGKAALIQTRLNAEEKAKFDEIKQAENVSESFLLLRQVRILITKEAHFSKAELAELRNSNQQLTAIGRNLNQVVQQINAGLITDSRLSQRYIEQLMEHIDRVSASVRGLIAKTLQRVV